uniref:non-specific serine/threonine protein kinase n=1 Tax=Oryza meridionalis TaxID=40149 RepID=A0A0E0DT82_9ORYZ
MEPRVLLVLALVAAAGVPAVLCQTNAQDAAALEGLKSQWTNYPSSWNSGDPCGGGWDGIMCTNGRVTTLRLSSVSLQGTLSSSIGQLGQLTYLDLSFNINLGGLLPAEIGNLGELTTLILAGCSFTGNIPIAIGNLRKLGFLALNSNKFSGGIPSSIGVLTNLLWLDLADNQLTGSVPISTSTSPGLDQLVKTQHFHFNKNQLTGTLTGLFNSNMTLIHILFDSNKFSGSIPAEVGTVSTLEVLRLDRNGFTGAIPATIGSLVKLNELNLANNKLTGSVPDLSNMTNLNVVDLSNNTFDPSVAPSWFTSLTSLASVSIVSGSLSGQVPKGLFTLPTLQQVLAGNPFCAEQDPNNRAFCSRQLQNASPYSTSMEKCGSAQCSDGQNVNPASCGCAFSYNGKMVFRAPFFVDLVSSTSFQLLESTMATKLNLLPGSVALSDIHFNSDNYLEVQVKLFPTSGVTFNLSELTRIGSSLSNQIYKPPANFGPYFFIADPYAPLAASWAAGQKDSGGAPQLKGARFFSFDELKICTNNFSDNHEIGSGGYGKVYRGILGDGTRVAIKRADRNSMQGAVEFKNEIELLSRVHHRNLVSLIGFCYEQGEQMLVYEYISNGTLRENLTGSGTYLDWKKRLRIALGSARGLAYLHELADPPIIHRDIKSTNILLDDNLKAKVADFGLSKLVADTEKGHVSTQVKGTLGYLDPEYYMTQQLSEKSDVYSFGVVMLELVSGRQPIEKGRYVVREVRLAIDPADHDHHYGLRGIVDPAIRDAARTPVFRRFVQLAMRCVDESAAARPAMGAVVKEIEAMLQNEPDDAGAGEGDSSADPSANEFDRYRGGGGGPPTHPYSDVEISRGSYAGDGASDYMPYFELVMNCAGIANGEKSTITMGAKAAIGAAGGLLVMALIFMAIFALRRKRKAKELAEQGTRFFCVDELKSCTGNFSDSHEIGSGGYGKVYKGTLADGTRVAIKRAQPGSMQGVVEFKNEIELLSRVHHRNLVRLIGYCYELGEQMLVYEYISNGTLRDNLMAKGTPLNWRKRLRIALGSARGLTYLHEHANPPIIHRDVKSTNILLDDNLKAKVADFGLSKLVRLAIDPADDDHYGLRGIVDPAIRDSTRTAGFRRFVQLAMRCVDDSTAARPAMGAVVKEIEAILQNEPATVDGSAGSSATDFEGAGGGDDVPDYLPFFGVKPPQWRNYPSSWNSGDPCGGGWDGVMCSNGRVTSLRLSSINLQGTLGTSIGLLTQLVYLDLSSNIGLGGPLPAEIGNLGQLTTLILAGCSFTGAIPKEIGNLSKLWFLALNSNKFTGGIPPSIGLLTNLFYLDLADNQLTGSIPISSPTSPGLDLLVQTKHLHFNKNQLTGTLTGLFNSKMTLLHIEILITSLFNRLFDSNQLSGSIPAELGGITTLEVVRLDRNGFGGAIPTNISNLVSLNQLDLSNNTFDTSVAPVWFTTLTSLTSVSIASGNLLGQVPKGLFTLPQLQQVLVGNPLCVDQDYSGKPFCSIRQENLIAYTTSMTQCSSSPDGQSLDPGNCGCASSYNGKMIFRAPSFVDVTTGEPFLQLETSLWTQLNLRPGSVYLSDVHWNSDNYLQVQVKLFPSSGLTFSLSEMTKIGFNLSNQTYKPPANFGPCAGGHHSKLSTAAKLWLAVVVGGGGCLVILLLLVRAVLCFIRLRKKRTKKPGQQPDPRPIMATSATANTSQEEASHSREGSEEVGIRSFSLEDVVEFTNNFSEKVGEGGFGTVYKGTLRDGRDVAVKRAKPESMDSGRGAAARAQAQLSNEINVTSKLHHRNLTPSLSWPKRLDIALGIAEGLVYLHSYANPWIIHCDLQSSNILLDNKLNAKIADFGLSKLIEDTVTSLVTSTVIGVRGHIAPEYHQDGRLSKQSDVYSFGLMMLELMSGKQPDKEPGIVQEFRSAISQADHQDRLHSIIDPKIRAAASSSSDAVQRFVQLAMRCVDDSRDMRPTMIAVAEEIRGMAQREPGCQQGESSNGASSACRASPSSSQGESSKGLSDSTASPSSSSQGESPKGLSDSRASPASGEGESSKGSSST